MVLNALTFTGPCGRYLKPRVKAGPGVMKIFSCSTQLLIKTKMSQIKIFLAFKLSDVVFILLINVKMPAIVGISTFISRINFALS